LEATPKLVFSDFDGTLTHGCCLGPVFFQIISLLEENNLPLIIVTGRSRAWGHFFLTHIQGIKAVMAEGGGVLIERDGKNLKESVLVDGEEVKRLELFTEKMLMDFPELELSIDSSGRLVDRAIELDLLEDAALKKKVITLMDGHKIQHSQSNVHLNFWCGEISKAKSVIEYLERESLSKDLKSYLYFGDSLNDESMFEVFPWCVGVSNISSVIDSLESKPSVILEGEKNEGPFGVLSYLQTLNLKKS